MTGARHALLRLFAVQGSWNYERMLGVGLGYAAEPLLEDLKATDPARYPGAVSRSAEFFNCNPNLAGLALGALVRAEYDAAPPAQISRLRTALCGPLGALGDQLFWAGLLPALIAAALGALALGAGWWAVVAFFLVYNAVRWRTAVWALQTGLSAGMNVGAAIGRSWIPRVVARVGPAAGFAVGLALPLVAAWFLEHYRPTAALAALGLTAGAVAGARWLGPRVTAIRIALVTVALTLLFRLVFP
ncbi:MAG TPA: PTS system mannose/fructose/sorbose family transporter subunit IID [Gemmatimonadales bacterium]|nr:PTS system mannose/fructose/sorbose family transporter subunit IID [Gemmatimonadales bacterium]